MSNKTNKPDTNCAGLLQQSGSDVTAKGSDGVCGNADVVTNRAPDYDFNGQQEVFTTILARPKSIRAIVSEALEAFDLEFNEIYQDIKQRIDAVIMQGAMNPEVSRILNRLEQIQSERKELGKKGLPDKVIAEKLIGETKQTRDEFYKMLGQDKM